MAAYVDQYRQAGTAADGTPIPAVGRRRQQLTADGLPEPYTPPADGGASWRQRRAAATAAATPTDGTTDGSPDGPTDPTAPPAPLDLPAAPAPVTDPTVPAAPAPVAPPAAVAGPGAVGDTTYAGYDSGSPAIGVVGRGAQAIDYANDGTSIIPAVDPPGAPQIAPDDAPVDQPGPPQYVPPGPASLPVDPSVPALPPIATPLVPETPIPAVGGRGIPDPIAAAGIDLGQSQSTIPEVPPADPLPGTSPTPGIAAATGTPAIDYANNGTSIIPAAGLPATPLPVPTTTPLDPPGAPQIAPTPTPATAPVSTPDVTPVPAVGSYATTQPTDFGLSSDTSAGGGGGGGATAPDPDQLAWAQANGLIYQNGAFYQGSVSNANLIGPDLNSYGNYVNRNNNAYGTDPSAPNPDVWAAAAANLASGALSQADYDKFIAATAPNGVAAARAAYGSPADGNIGGNGTVPVDPPGPPQVTPPTPPTTPTPTTTPVPTPTGTGGGTGGTGTPTPTPSDPGTAANSIDPAVLQQLLQLIGSGQSTVPTAANTSFGPGSDLIGTQINPSDSPLLESELGQVATASQAVGAPSSTADVLAQYMAQQTAAANNLNTGPTRSQIAQQQLDAFDLQAQPGIRDGIRAVGQRAAQLGRLGMGDTAVEALQPYTDYLNNRAALEEQLAASTAAGEIQDRQSNLSADQGLVNSTNSNAAQQAADARSNLSTLSGVAGQQASQDQADTNEQLTEQQYESNTSQQALENAIQQYQLEQQSQNQDFTQGLDLAEFGYGGNPGSLELNGAQLSDVQLQALLKALGGG